MKLMRNIAVQYLGAIILAILSSRLNSPTLTLLADFIADSFVLILKWCSIPMISLAILSATSGLDNKTELLSMGKNVLKYTLITTVIAATTALLLFLLINPTNFDLPAISGSFATDDGHSHSFGSILIATMLIAILLSSIILRCQQPTKSAIHHHLTVIYKKFMATLQIVIKLMPLAIWAFVTLFIKDIDGLVATSIFLYLSCIILANLIQAFVVLPCLLYSRGISAPALAAAMWPAISVAFWSKSSGVALPMAINCAVGKANLNEKIAKFSLPICTTINMNACSAFILITVLFISTSYGISYSAWELLAWIGIATLAAIGNASVPMGCFTMAMTLLTFNKVPLQAMGLIIPFYAIIDMLESAINLWSDACVTALVAKDAEAVATVLSTP